MGKYKVVNNVNNMTRINTTKKVFTSMLSDRPLNIIDCYDWCLLTKACTRGVELHSRWRCWCTVHCTALHHHTWRRHSYVSPTCRTDARSGPHPLNELTFQPAVGQQSEVVLLLLLVQRRGTACQAISFVAGGVQEQAQDVLVPPLLRNCLTLNDIFFSQ